MAAAVVALSPVIAAAAMALSSLSVVTNANRLRRYHPAPLPEAEVTDVEPQVQAGTGHAPSALMHNGGAGQGHGAFAHTATGHRPSGGVTATDPVCGMNVDPATTAAHSDTPGGTVYFCSAGCAAAFDAGPARYAAAATKTTPGAGTR